MSLKNDISEEDVMTATVKILVDARNAQDRISECVEDLKSAWRARIQKGEEFLASTSKINSRAENDQLVVHFGFTKNGRAKRN